jgi:hypothetical protein
MSNLLVLLVLLVTTLFSSPFSPASGQNPLPRTLVGFRVIDNEEVRLAPVPPGGSFKLALSVFEIARVCITRVSPAGNCESSDDNLPAGTRLLSTNPVVASVSSASGVTSIRLRSPGSTTLEWRRNRDNRRFAFYQLEITPIPRFSFRGFGGSNVVSVTPDGGLPPDGVLEISLSSLDNHLISGLCFRETTEDCNDTSGDIPSNTQLRSTNPAVASVCREDPNTLELTCSDSVESDIQSRIRLMNPGSTTLQLRRDGEILAFYILVVTPPPFPGTQCGFASDQEGGIVDCSGNCVSIEDICEKLGDGTCDDGRRGINLSCAFTPDFFLNGFDGQDIVGCAFSSNGISTTNPFLTRVLEDLVDVDVFDENLNLLATTRKDLVEFDIGNPEDQSIAITSEPPCRPCIASPCDDICPPSPRDAINTFVSLRLSFFSGSAPLAPEIPLYTISTDLDGGDCSLEESCTAQFGAAPGFELCEGGATARFCRFNADTRNATTGRPDTCAAMCQRFASRCLAALDNNPGGCTPLPTSADTCNTPRNSEICVCERG